jgi:hypothetical protein
VVTTSKVCRAALLEIQGLLKSGICGYRNRIGSQIKIQFERKKFYVEPWSVFRIGDF